LVDIHLQTLFQDALAAPSSPIFPHISIPETPRVQQSAHAPRTPYTPFTAFPTRRNFFDNSALPIPFLDESDNPLSRLYNQVLRFIGRDLSYIMDIAERVALKASTRPVEPTPMLTSSHGELEFQGTQGFDIFANVIWPEIGQAIMDELGSVVFAAGRPDDFLKVGKPLLVAFVADHGISIASRSYSSIRSRPRIHSPYYAIRSSDEITSRLHCIQPTLAIAHIFPTSLERNCWKTRRQFKHHCHLPR